MISLANAGRIALARQNSTFNTELIFTSNKSKDMSTNLCI